MEAKGSFDQDLLFLLQVLHNGQRDIQRLSHDGGRGKGQPLGQADVGHAVTLVDFDPDKFLGWRGVFDVMACHRELAKK